MNRLTRNSIKQEFSKDRDPSITGYNIGFNAGADAGQTSFPLPYAPYSKKK